MNDICKVLQFILRRFHLNIPFTKNCETCEEAFAVYLEPNGILASAVDASEIRACKNEYLLAFTEDGRAVAVAPSVFGSACFDLSDGVKRIPFKDAAFKGKAYLISRPFPKGDGSFKDFILLVLRLLRPTDYLLLTGIPLLITLLGLVFPAITNYIVNDTIADSASAFSSVFFSQLALFVSFGIFRSFARMANGMLMVSVRNRISVQAESALMARTLLLPERFFEEISAGGIPKRLAAVCTTVEISLNLLADMALLALALICYIPQMIRYAPVLTLCTLPFLALEVLFGLWFTNKKKKINLRLYDGMIQQDNLNYDVFKGMQKIQLYHAETAIEEKWKDNLEQTLTLQYDPPFLIKLGDGLPLLISSAVTLALISLLAPLGIPVGIYIAFSASFGILSASVMEWNTLVSSLLLVPAQIQCLKPVFAQKLENSAEKDFVRFLSGAVRVRDLFFRYRDDAPYVLKGISFDIKQGEKIAIVGASGGGKSTLIKLLVGFLTPTSGDIQYDGTNINAVNTKSLRKKMGIVLQTSRLMPGSIAENMRYSHTDATDAQIWNAFEKARFRTDVEKLDGKLAHILPDIRGCGLSGGQVQRFLFARALVCEPSVLVLDEPFSALDASTLQQTLDTVFSLDSTVILVSHRLSSVIRCDKILVLQDGVIAECGTFQELMQKNGTFAKMVREQNAQLSESGE